MKKFFGLVLIMVTLTFFLARGLQADSIDDQINQIKRDLDSLTQQLQSKEANYQKLNSQLQDIKSRIGFLEQEIVKKAQEVDQGEKALEYQKQLLNERARSYYKNLGKNPDSLLTLFVSENISQSLENFFYQKSLVNQDKDMIIKIVLYIKNLEEKKASLEGERTQLSSLKKSLDQQSLALSGEITSTRQKISDLSAKQQQLIAAKQSALAASAGRSMDTQTTSSACSVSSISYPSTIRVKFSDGHVESMSFEDQYLKGLGEMPRAWASENNSQEAFKSQIVAARSYALFKMTRSSCRDYDVYSTTADQAYTGNTGDDNWNRAVNDTKGQFLQRDGKVIIAYYSANSGGHTLSPNEAWNGGGDYPNGTDDNGSDGKANGDLNARCIGTLRWEYHYNVGREGKVQYNDTCSGGDINNNNSPMSNEEVEDIVDATTWALKNGHVPENSTSHDQIKGDIGGDAIGAIQSISASIADNKYTNNVHVVGSNKTIDFSGDNAQTFRLVFNIRSPGQFLIPATAYGAHYVKFDILSSSDAHGTQGQGWYFYTYGYGHRIGLDQEGALGMASQGKNYTDILSHYYSGTNLTSKDYSGQVQ